MTAVLVATSALPLSAATGHVSGTLTIREKIGLSGKALAVVSIVDMVVGANAGVIVGQQRIDAIGEVPVPFSVPYDVNRIDPRHAYGLFATLIDGATSWQNSQGIAVLTGGPTSGVDAILPLAGAPAATIVGSITMTARATLGPGTVAVAELIKKETGTVVNRQVRPAPGRPPIAFSIGFDPSVIDPRATYLVKAALIDGGRVWDNRVGVLAITAGVALPAVAVPVAAAAGSLPGASPSPSRATPSAAPSASPASATPSGSIAANPSGPSPSGSSTTPSSPPTLSPSPTATATPTASPAPTPTPRATPTASAIPAPTATPRPSATAGTTSAASTQPATGLLTGSLAYAEPHQLSADAVAVVILVRGSAGPNQNPIVATEIIRAPAATPVSFRLAYDAALIHPGVSYSLQAGIVDGANAWSTGRGTAVASAGGPAAPVDLVLAYRPDLVKGEVTGSLTGAALRPTSAAYAVAVLIDPATGQSLGMDVRPTVGEVPVPFSVPFPLAAIDPARDYLVDARIVEGERTWQSEAGVPVITRGNPVADVQVVVTDAGAPRASPSPEAGSGFGAIGAFGELGLGIIVLVLALIIGGAGIVLYDRSRPGGAPPAAPGSTA